MLLTTHTHTHIHTTHTPHAHAPVVHGQNITENLVVGGGVESMVVAERLLGDELDFNEPSDGGPTPKELSRVFSFSFYEAPQSSVYRWSINIGIDNIT